MANVINLPNLARSAVDLSPDHHEAVEIRPATFSAGTMPGSQGRGFVQEEEFRVDAGGHHPTPAILEVQQAGDPTLALVGAGHLAPAVEEFAT